MYALLFSQMCMKCIWDLGCRYNVRSLIRGAPDSQLREYYLTTTRYSAQILLPFNWTIEITFHQEFLLGLSVSHLTRHMLLGSLSLNTYTEITPHLTKMSHCSSSSLALLGFLTTNKNYMFVLVKKTTFYFAFCTTYGFILSRKRRYMENDFEMIEHRGHQTEHILVGRWKPIGINP